MLKIHVVFKDIDEEIKVRTFVDDYSSDVESSVMEFLNEKNDSVVAVFEGERLMPKIGLAIFPTGK